MKHLKCPECRCKFKNVTIRDGAVRCPECDHVMFQYRLEGDDNLTPKTFFELMTTRGVEAGRAAILWMPHRNKVAQQFATGQLIMYLWPLLAQTFVKEETE